MTYLKPLFISLISCALSIHAYAQLTTLPGGKKIDTRLVGVWKGAETDRQQKGMHKSWEMARKADGTFTLGFVITTNGKTDSLKETGHWWVKGNRFYEHHAESDGTDVYRYQVLSPQHVQYTPVKMAMDKKLKDYTFTDTLMHTTAAVADDDPKFRDAVKVNSIREEYDYVRAHCEGCKVVQQALVHRKSGPYDILTVQKPDGTNTLYHFYVGAFFGKF